MRCPTPSLKHHISPLNTGFNPCNICVSQPKAPKPSLDRSPQSFHTPLLESSNRGERSLHVTALG